MTVELLYKIADIINSNSEEFHAVVPKAKHDYMAQRKDSPKLVRESCFVLHIIRHWKKGYRVYRTVWNIYEKDIDKIIEKVCRRDQDFAKRIALCEPTAKDVEMLVRRASFKSLRLKIADPLLYMYVKDDDADITK